jgi:cytochrome c oxidase assembly factor CtaG
MGHWYFSVLLAVVGVGGHYYLWARLRDVGLSTPSRQALPWVLGGLAVSIPLAVVTSRFGRPEWSVW